MENERKVVAAEDTQEIEVRLGTTFAKKFDETGDDPFAQKVEDLKTVTGLDQNFRRKMNRSLEKVYRGQNGAATKQIELDYVGGYTLFEAVVPPYNMDYLAKLFEISAPHYAAVRAKVSNIVGLGFDLTESAKAKEVIDKTDAGDKTDKLRRRLTKAKTEILDWIDGCNEDDTFVETLQKVWTDYETTGNGYLEIGRDVEGQVNYLGHIPSTTMRIRRHRDGFIQLVSNQARFFRNFGDKTTPNPFGSDRPNEVIHFKKYTPTNGFYGVPDIIAAKTAIAGNEFAARYNLDYFENKAVPRYVIVIKGGKLGAVSERRILEFFETNLKGQNHRTLFIPLPADEADRKTSFDMQAVESGIQDSSFTNYRKANLNDILMAHRVPLSKVSVSESASLAAAKDADKTFKEQVCRPEQDIMEKKINKIIHERTDIFDFKLNELTLTDADTQSKIDERDIRNQLTVPNEVRARRGLPGLPSGDKVVDLKPQQAADARATQGQTRTRDQQRANNASDTNGEARSPKGDGRQAP